MAPKKKPTTSNGLGSPLERLKQRKIATDAANKAYGMTQKRSATQPPKKRIK